MQKSQVRIEYFGEKGDVRFKIVQRHQLPGLASNRTYWLPDEMENQEMAQRGARLKQRIAKVFSK